MLPTMWITNGRKYSPKILKISSVTIYITKNVPWKFPFKIFPGIQIIESLPSLPPIDEEIPEDLNPLDQDNQQDITTAEEPEPDYPPEELVQSQTDPQSGSYLISATRAEISR